VKGIRTTLIVTGLAIVGAIVGAALGYLAGIAFVMLMNVSSIEGESGMMVFYEFMPLGALLGIISTPIMFGIWRRTRR
jgi:hypothetical protein